jgi:hypothetical protein
LVTGISDSKIAKDDLKRLTDTKTFGAAYTLSGYMSPNLGMTNWQGGALNLLNWAIGPKQHGARSSLIAWMPENEATNAKKAQDKMEPVRNFVCPKSRLNFTASIMSL